MKDHIRTGVTVVLFVALAVHWKAAGQLARYHYQGQRQEGSRTTRRASRRLHQERFAVEVKQHQFAEMVAPSPSWDDTGFIRRPTLDRRFRALSRTQLQRDALRKVKELTSWRARGQ